MINKTLFGTRCILAAATATLLGFGLSSKASAQINLIQNPGFETGNFDDWTTTDAASGSDFGVDTGDQHSGLYGAYFAGVTYGDFDSISQNVHTLAGVQYKLTFWLASNDTGPAAFNALWNGKVVFSTSNVEFNYTKETVAGLVATSALSSLGFEGYELPADYSLDDITLTPLSFRAFALTPNQSSVALALDQATNDPRAAKLIAFLQNQTAETLPQDFDLISPEALTAIFEISRSLSDVQFDNIENHLATYRAEQEAANGTTVGLLADGKDSKDSKGASTAPVSEGHRWNLWMDGSGDFVHVNGDHNAAGYDFTTGGVTLGADYRVCDHLVVGLMGGYANTGSTLTQGGSVDVNGGKLGVYATGFKNGFYLNTMATGGYNSYDTHRTGLGGIAQGNTDGEEFDGLIGGGYDFRSGNWTTGPVVSGRYTYVGLNGFTENGSLAPLSFGAQSQESFRTRAGWKVSSDWTWHGMKITPTVTAGWQHEYLDSSFALDSNFANGAGNTFTVNGPKLGRDSVVVNAGVNVQITERVSSYLYYDGELGRMDYQQNSVTGGFKIGF